MNRRLLYVAGPSGAGKDSLLAWLRAQLTPGLPVHWARRSITRAADAGGESHESLDMAVFERLSAAAAFALEWRANGLAYGVRHTELRPLQLGHWVLLNGSRAYLPEAQQRFPGLRVVHITASAQRLQQRLQARGRESAPEIAARVLRAIDAAPRDAAITVHNDSTLEDAGLALLQALAALADWPRA